MDRLERSERAAGASPAVLAEYSLEEWVLAGRPVDASVHVDAAEELEAHYAALSAVARVIVGFPAFTDGRGFSHARKLRAAGFSGALWAAGDLLADQWHFLQRCGFTRLADGSARPDETAPFSDAYQSDEKQTTPLFRRR